ncbi:PrgI family protein [Patescibacteria group bacterium]|nr:PrgI family protein [Patescibacteria group bacterium]
MKQFVVPQFIDVEDKIIGPITTRQFIILIVAGMALFLEYKLSDMAMFLTAGLPTLGIFGIIAFLKVNGMPFHYFFLNIVQTLKKPAIRVWSREAGAEALISADIKKGGKKASELLPKKFIASSKLSDLSLIVDTGGLYRGESAEKEYSFKTGEGN